MRTVWIVGSIVGATAGCFDGLVLDPPPDNEPLTATVQPAASMEEIYGAIKLENLRTTSGATAFFAGTTVDFGFDFVSRSRKPVVVPHNDVYGSYVIGVEQAWISRLGADPSLPFPTGYARKGDWYAAGGQIVVANEMLDARHRLRYGATLARTGSIAMTDFPPGDYRYIVEYKQLGSGIYDGVIDSAQIDFTLDEAPNYAFVTSTMYDGNLGGLAGADAICQARAEAGGLPGTYRAWLSTDTVDAIDRLGNARGWRRPDGQLVADTAAELAQGIMFHPIRIDEYGHDVGTLAVFTATQNGRLSTYSSNTCNGWTSNANTGPVSGGMSSAEGPAFSFIFVMHCAVTLRLYCFGVDRTAAVAPTPVAGRTVFVSNAAWRPGSGIATADAMCQSDAQGAGFAGTYRAALAVNGASVASRFDATGLPWVRPDGVAVTTTAAGFFTAQFYDSAPNVAANGEHQGNTMMWNGASNLTVNGADATTCTSWTNGSAGSYATGGRAGATDTGVRYGMDTTIGCDATWIYVTCMQL